MNSGFSANEQPENRCNTDTSRLCGAVDASRLTIDIEYIKFGFTCKLSFRSNSIHKIDW